MCWGPSSTAHRGDRSRQNDRPVGIASHDGHETIRADADLREPLRQEAPPRLVRHNAPGLSDVVRHLEGVSRQRRHDGNRAEIG